MLSHRTQSAQVLSTRSVGVAASTSLASLAHAGSPQPFLERGIARGINYPIQTGFVQFGPGLGLFYLDGDGDPDAIVQGAMDGRVGLYENDGSGQFTDRTNDGVTPRMAKHTDYGGVSAADYDSDGDLDVYLTRYGAPNILYRNDGGTFTNVTASLAPRLSVNRRQRVAIWGDMNNDGKIDFMRNQGGSGSQKMEIYLQDSLTGIFGDGRGGTIPIYVGSSSSDDVQITGGLNTEALGYFDLEGDGKRYLHESGRQLCQSRRDWPGHQWEQGSRGPLRPGQRRRLRRRLDRQRWQLPLAF